MYKRRRGLHPVVVILVFAVICVAVTAITLFFMGYRYSTSAEGIKFFGKVSNGQPVTGTIRYPDGKSGQLDYFNNTITYSNGDVYEGDIYSVYRHGTGKMTFKATEDVYEGDFQYDKMTGKGIYRFRNEDVYEGDLVDAKKHGEGTYTWKDTSYYVGSFVNGYMEGKGTFQFSDNSKYVGDLKEGQKHGEGTFWFSNGDIYTGWFVNDKRTGTGTYTWENDEKYTGNFVNNYIDTRLIDEDGNFIKNEDGSYKHGEKATYSWPNGKSYTGYFENGSIVVIDTGGQ